MKRKEERTKTAHLRAKHHEAVTALAEREGKTFRQTLDELLDTAFAVKRIPLKGEVKA